MNKLAARLGFWSSFGGAAAFLLFIVCFTAIALTNPLFTWTNLSDYLAYNQKYDQTFRYIAQTAMLCFGPLYVLMLNSIHDFARDEMKPLSRAAIAFGAIFAALIGIHYFVQISAVRLNVDKGQVEGIEQFLQANPSSAIMAVNMLGWTLFLGLSSLFIAPVFSGSKLAGAIRLLFLLNGAFCILAGIGYVFEIVPLVFVTINLGMGGCVTALTILLCFFFRRGASPLS
jgi:hypothetical protein